MELRDGKITLKEYQKYVQSILDDNSKNLNIDDITCLYLWRNNAPRDLVKLKMKNH